MSGRYFRPQKVPRATMEKTVSTAGPVRSDRRARPDRPVRWVCPDRRVNPAPKDRPEFRAVPACPVTRATRAAMDLPVPTERPVNKDFPDLRDPVRITSALSSRRSLKE